MSNTIHTAAFLALSFFALSASGCALDGTHDDTTSTSQDELGKTKHHYEPSVQAVTWAIGCGVVRPDQVCKSGLYMTYTKNYIDLQTTIATHVDNTHGVLTIDLDTWSHNTVHPLVMVRPEEIHLSPDNLQMGRAYHVVVRDRSHHELFATDISTFLAY